MFGFNMVPDISFRRTLMMADIAQISSTLITNYKLVKVFK